MIPAIAPALNEDDGVGEESDVGTVMISDGIAVVRRVDGAENGGMVVSHGYWNWMVEMSGVLVAPGWVGWDGGVTVCVNIGELVRGTVNVLSVVDGPSISVPEVVPEVVVMDVCSPPGSDAVVVVGT